MTRPKPVSPSTRQAFAHAATTLRAAQPTAAKASLRFRTAFQAAKASAGPVRPDEETT